MQLQLAKVFTAMKQSQKQQQQHALQNQDRFDLQITDQDIENSSFNSSERHRQMQKSPSSKSNKSNTEFSKSNSDFLKNIDRAINEEIQQVNRKYPVHNKSYDKSFDKSYDKSCDKSYDKFFDKPFLKANEYVKHKMEDLKMKDLNSNNFGNNFSVEEIKKKSLDQQLLERNSAKISSALNNTKSAKSTKFIKKRNERKNMKPLIPDLTEEEKSEMEKSQRLDTEAKRLITELSQDFEEISQISQISQISDNQLGMNQLGKLELGKTKPFENTGHNGMFEQTGFEHTGHNGMIFENQARLATTYDCQQNLREEEYWRQNALRMEREQKNVRNQTTNQTPQKRNLLKKSKNRKKKTQQYEIQEEDQEEDNNLNHSDLMHDPSYQEFFNTTTLNNQLEKGMLSNYYQQSVENLNHMNLINKGFVERSVQKVMGKRSSLYNNRLYDSGSSVKFGGPGFGGSKTLISTPTKWKKKTKSKQLQEITPTYKSKLLNPKLLS